MRKQSETAPNNGTINAIMLTNMQNVVVIEETGGMVILPPPPRPGQKVPSFERHNLKQVAVDFPNPYDVPARSYELTIHLPVKLAVSGDFGNPAGRVVPGERSIDP
jgi:hypothetical protein